MSTEENKEIKRDEALKNEHKQMLMPQFFSIEKDIDGKKCHFFMEAGVNLGGAYDFVFSILRYILERSNDAALAAKQVVQNKKEPETKSQETKSQETKSQ